MGRRDLLVFVVEVLLEQNPFHLFRNHLWKLLCCNSRVEYLLPRPCGPQNLQYSLSGHSQSLLSRALDPGVGKDLEIPRIRFSCI